MIASIVLMLPGYGIFGLAWAAQHRWLRVLLSLAASIWLLLSAIMCLFAVAGDDHGGHSWYLVLAAIHALAALGAFVFVFVAAFSESRVTSPFR